MILINHDGDAFGDDNDDVECQTKMLDTLTLFPVLAFVSWLLPYKIKYRNSAFKYLFVC